MLEIGIRGDQHQQASQFGSLKKLAVLQGRTCTTLAQVRCAPRAQERPAPAQD